MLHFHFESQKKKHFNFFLSPKRLQNQNRSVESVIFSEIVRKMKFRFLSVIEEKIVKLIDSDRE